MDDVVAELIDRVWRDCSSNPHNQLRVIIAKWLACSPDISRFGPYRAQLPVLGHYVRASHAALWTNPAYNWPKLKTFLLGTDSYGTFVVKQDAGRELVGLNLEALKARAIAARSPSPPHGDPTADVNRPATPFEGNRSVPLPPPAPLARAVGSLPHPAATATAPSSPVAMPAASGTPATSTAGAPEGDMETTTTENAAVLRRLVHAAFPTTADDRDSNAVAKLYRGIALWLVESPSPKLGPHSVLLSGVGVYLRNHHAALWLDPRRHWPKAMVLLTQPESKGVFSVKVPAGGKSQVVRLDIAALQCAVAATSTRAPLPRVRAAPASAPGAAMQSTPTAAAAAAGPPPRVASASTLPVSAALASGQGRPGPSQDLQSSRPMATSGGGGGSDASPAVGDQLDGLMEAAAATAWPGHDPLSVIKRRSAVLLAAVGEQGADGHPYALLMARLCELLGKQDPATLKAYAALRAQIPRRPLWQLLNEGPVESDVSAGEDIRGGDGGAREFLRAFKGRHDVVMKLDRAALLAAAQSSWQSRPQTGSLATARAPKPTPSVAPSAPARAAPGAGSGAPGGSPGVVAAERVSPDPRTATTRAVLPRGAAGAPAAGAPAVGVSTAGPAGRGGSEPLGAPALRGASVGLAVEASVAAAGPVGAVNDAGTTTAAAAPVIVPPARSWLQSASESPSAASRISSEKVAAMVAAVWPGTDVTSHVRRVAAVRLAAVERGPLGPFSMLWARLIVLIRKEVPRADARLSAACVGHVSAKIMLRQAVDGAIAAAGPPESDPLPGSTAATGTAVAGGTRTAGAAMTTGTTTAAGTAGGAGAGPSAEGAAAAAAVLAPGDAIMIVVPQAGDCVAKLNLAALARAAARQAVANGRQKQQQQQGGQVATERPRAAPPLNGSVVSRSAVTTASAAGGTAVPNAATAATAAAGAAGGASTQGAGCGEGASRLGLLEQALWQRFLPPAIADASGAASHREVHTFCAAKRCVAALLAAAPPPHELSLAELGAKVSRYLGREPLGSRLRMACQEDPDVFSVTKAGKSHYVVRLVSRELRRLAAAVQAKQEPAATPIARTPASGSASTGPAAGQGTSGQQGRAGPYSAGAATRLQPSPGPAVEGSAPQVNASSPHPRPLEQPQPQTQTQTQTQPKPQHAAVVIPVPIPVPVEPPLGAARRGPGSPVPLPVAAPTGAEAGPSVLVPSASCFQPPVVGDVQASLVAAADGLGSAVANAAVSQATDTGGVAPGAPVHFVIDPYSPELMTMLQHCLSCSQIGLAVHSYGGAPVLVAVYAPDAPPAGQQQTGPGSGMGVELGSWPAAVYLLNGTACEEMYGGGVAGKEVASKLMASLRELLKAPCVAKIVHGCEQILALEAACGGAATSPLLDTRVVLTALTSMLGLPDAPAGAMAEQLQQYVSTLQDTLAATGLWADRPGLLSALTWRQLEALSREGSFYGNGGGNGVVVSPTQEQMTAVAGMAAFLPELWSAMVDEAMPWIAVHAPLAIMTRARAAAQAVRT